jgi:hypothetical protein
MKFSEIKINDLTLIPLNLDIALNGRKALKALSTRKKPMPLLAKLNAELTVEIFEIWNKNFCSK